MTPLARAGLLAGASALALAPLACHKHDVLPIECLRLEGPRQPVGFGGTFSIKATLNSIDLETRLPTRSRRPATYGS